LASLIKSDQADLIKDPRVRAVITEHLFKGVLLGPVIVSVACASFWYQSELWTGAAFLNAILICWFLNSVVLVFLYFYHRSQPLLKRHAPEGSSRYLRFLMSNLCVDKFCMGIATLLTYIARPDWAIAAVAGLVLYMYGTFIKNMSYSGITRYFPLILCTPLIFAFVTQGDRLHQVLAFYFVLNIFYLTWQAPHIAAVIQLPIKQKFELEELTQKLNTERDRADAANAAKSHFFTAASHDARQPLQVISLLFQSLQKSSQINHQDKSIIDKIDINLNTIRSLFDRVLDISRIDSGNVTPHMQAVQLQPLFDKFDAQFGELAASKGLWLRFVPTQAWVMHDSELLDRILSNLVHNAIKYTHTGGVWVAWRGARTRIEVRDTGLGISTDHQLTIFDEFSQINNPARNNEAGLGLGLSIVKRLADLTQTALGLKSKLGRGSTFWLSLQTVQTTQTENASNRDILKISGVPLAKLHLLFAEDEPQIRELFTSLLQAAGAVVYSCANVNDAKEYIDNNPSINVVLTDYRLGESGTGIDIVHYARDVQIARNINSNTADTILPAIILTGDTAVKDLKSIQQLAHCTLLHKPVEFDKLVSELIAVTSQHTE
jgi:two-component system, sensor histidine kinase